jgi:hypothetical protein
MERSKEDIKKFWSHVEKTETCWLWNSTKREGYGLFYVNGKTLSAHRFSFEICVGEIPTDKFVLHKTICSNRHCVNPDHLYIGTQKDNVKDADSQGKVRGWMRRGNSFNRSKTHCPKGHPYSEENTYYRQSRRHCLTCMKERNSRALTKGL